ncbi:MULTISPECIES: transposase [Archangium]|uniref:Transposase n=1 Tax=Archangium lansingense TaxID=2995310 RepID=A0ABT4AD47_9BACT|nr:transposase [Archangium lansinium]MCY1079589.1 transposase [Archangium lansinium]WPB81822.1 transposase [Archangium gephyra]
MKERAEKFRQQVLERGGVGPRARYTREQRQEAVAYVRERQQQGAGIEESAKELGMSSWTLSRWGSAARRAQQEPERAALVPVEVKPARGVAQAGALVVHGPGGVRVEGVSVEDAVALLRGLV